MEDPIESVQFPHRMVLLIRIANAESGTLMGVEIEFLQDLKFVGDGIWENLFRQVT